jgi:hypothetical protein
MNRRCFVQAGMSSLLVPAAIVASPHEGPRPGMTLVEPAWHYVFVDDRFPAARQLASELCGSTIPTPVLGDVTDLWTGGLATASLAAPMTLAGITTESFFFCLKTLLADRVRVDATTTRRDRDLQLWTIRTDNHSKNGTMSWQNHFRRV